MEGKQKLLPIGSLTCCNGNSLIYLVCVLQELSDSKYQNRSNKRKCPEIVGDPLLTELTKCERVIRGIVSVLVLLYCFSVLVASVKCITDTDIRRIKVGVSLKDLGPVVNSLVVTSVILMLDGLKKHVSVLCSLINRKRCFLGAIKEKHCCSLIVDSTK